MKKKKCRVRKNQKLKRKSAGTNKGCRYTMTKWGMIPRHFVDEE